MTTCLGRLGISLGSVPSIVFSRETSYVWDGIDQSAIFDPNLLKQSSTLHSSAYRSDRSIRGSAGDSASLTTLMSVETRSFRKTNIDGVVQIAKGSLDRSQQKVVSQKQVSERLCAV